VEGWIVDKAGAKRKIFFFRYRWLERFVIVVVWRDKGLSTCFKLWMEWWTDWPIPLSTGPTSSIKKESSFN